MPGFAKRREENAWLLQAGVLRRTGAAGTSSTEPPVVGGPEGRGDSWWCRRREEWGWGGPRNTCGGGRTSCPSSHPNSRIPAAKQGIAGAPLWTGEAGEPCRSSTHCLLRSPPKPVHTHHPKWEIQKLKSDPPPTHNFQSTSKDLTPDSRQTAQRNPTQKERVPT